VLLLLLLLLLLLCVTDKSHPSLVDMIDMAFIATTHYDQHSLVDAPLQRGGVILTCDSATQQRS
jgi:hypothetical protein